MRTFALKMCICTMWCDHIYGARAFPFLTIDAHFFFFFSLLPDEIENHHHFRLHFITFGFSLFILSRAPFSSLSSSPYFLTVYSLNAFLHFSHVHFIAFFIVFFFFLFALPFGFLGRFVSVCICNFYVPQRVQYIALIALFDRRHVVCFCLHIWYGGNCANNMAMATTMRQLWPPSCNSLFSFVACFFFSCAVFSLSISSSLEWFFSSLFLYDQQSTIEQTYRQAWKASHDIQLK